MHKIIKIKNHPDEIGRLQKSFRAFALRAELPNSTTMTILIVLDEIVGNIINYGDFAPGSENNDISIEIDTSDEMLMIIISDTAGAFDPLLAPEPDVVSPLEKRKIGGLGIYIVKSLMDSMEYCRDSGKNVLKLTCQIQPQADKDTS